MAGLKSICVGARCKVAGLYVLVVYMTTQQPQPPLLSSIGSGGVRSGVGLGVGFGGSSIWGGAWGVTGVLGLARGVCGTLSEILGMVE